MDPSDHLHLLLTFHESCLPPHAHVCIAETFDAGKSWQLHDGDSRWTSDGEGVKAYFLEDKNTWLWMSQADGMWRSTDAGKTWTQLTSENANHLQSTQVHRTKNGTFLVGGMGSFWRSPTGTSAGTWTKIATPGTLPGGVVSDGNTIYMSTCYYPGFCDPAFDMIYLTASENDVDTWTPMASPPISVMKSGGILGYDPGHHMLFSSNTGGGFWRLVTK